MTTINNSENLIEKVGGIEKAREVVAGAPDEASFYQEIDDQIIYILDGGGIHWWFNPNDNSWNKDYSDKRTMQSLNDLRTAIASHEPKMHSHLTSDALQGDDTAKHDSREFKVGDLVVFDTTKEFCAKLPDDLMEFRVRKDIDAIVTQGSRWFAVSFVAIRHATPSEIKAGHRLEAERHG